MATRVIDDTKLQNIAVAIQGKDSGGVMTVDEMPTRIAAIPTGSEVLFSGDGRQYTRTVEIPNNVTTIGDYAFNGCTGLTNITLPDSLTTINQRAFNGCTGLTNITFPDSLTTINQNAFSGCTRLTNIVLPDSLTTIKQSAFENCTGLTNIVLPDSLTTINQNAFGGCTGLTEIDLNNVTTLLNDMHFQSCSSLRKAVGKKAATVSGSCFYFCKSLTTAIFPVATTIQQNAFLFASSLENVDCRNVDRIVQNAFGRCPQLSLIDLTSRTTPTTLDRTDAFDKTNDTWIAVVANDTIKSDFQNATNWSTFASHFRTIAEVEAEVGMTYDEYYYQLFGEPRNEVAA